MSRIRDILPSGFALIAIGLLFVAAGFLWVCWHAPVPDYRTQSTSMALSSSDAAPAVSAERAVAPDRIASDLLERPLFMRDRRPYTEAAVEVIPPAPAPEPVITAAPAAPAPEPEPRAPPHAPMIGIYADQSGLAALMRGDDGDERWVRIGEQLEGWRVTSITRNAITLQSDGESVVITSSE